MKKWILGSVVMLVLCGMNAKAEAVILPFEDLIDTWATFDSFPIVEGFPLTYTHDISDQVNLGSGDQALTTNLELNFINDDTDIFLGIIFDGREFVSYGIRGDNDLVDDLTGSLGEVDNGQYDLALNVDWLNDDGKVDVKLSSSNFGNNTAVAWLDRSRLYGTYEHTGEQTQTVTPEPATMALLGSGLLGFVGLRKKRS